MVIMVVADGEFRVGGPARQPDLGCWFSLGRE